MVEYLSIQHPNAANPDDSVSITNSAVLAVVTVTDADGDSGHPFASQSAAMIQFQDSGPIMTAAQNINIQNSGDVAQPARSPSTCGADGAQHDKRRHHQRDGQRDGHRYCGHELGAYARRGECDDRELFVQLRLSERWRQYRA